MQPICVLLVGYVSTDYCRVTSHLEESHPLFGDSMAGIIAHKECKPADCPLGYYDSLGRPYNMAQSSFLVRDLCYNLVSVVRGIYIHLPVRVVLCGSIRTIGARA